MQRFFEFNQVKDEPEEKPAVITEIIFAEPINFVEVPGHMSAPVVKKEEESEKPAVVFDKWMEDDNWQGDDAWEDEAPTSPPGANAPIVEEVQEPTISVEAEAPKLNTPEEEVKQNQEALQYYLSCFLCYTDFPKSIDKKNHLKTQHKAKNKCPCCKKRKFRSILKYERHMRRHICGNYKKILRFSCDLCGITKNRMETITIHMSDHARAFENLRKEPNPCNELFPDPRIDPTKRQRFVCKQCGLTFRKRHIWYNHYYDQHANTICRYCKQEFGDVKATKEHETVEHSEGPKSFTCEVCSQVCGKWRYFECHQRRHRPANWNLKNKVGSDDHRIKCDYCNFTYVRLDQLELHTKKFHKDGQRSDKVRKQYFLINKDDKDENVEKPHECFICHEKFAKAQQKLRHIRNDHAEYAHLDCQQCPKKNIKSPIAYELHMKMHISGFEATCPHCGKQFYTAHHMMSHVFIAHKQKEVICDLCGYRTSRYKILRHIRMKHTAQPEYRCHLCDHKPSRTEVALQNHLNRKHGHASRFQCSICQKGFSYRLTCNTHELRCMRKHGRSSNDLQTRDQMPPTVNYY